MDEIRERTTPLFEGDLVDADGAAIPLSALTTLKLTLKDVLTGTILNSRSKQHVLNANGVTVHATSGHLAWQMAELDTVMATAALPFEYHLALFEWTYNAGAKRGELAYVHRVRNFLDVPGLDDLGMGMDPLGIFDLQTFKDYLKMTGGEDAQDAILVILGNGVSAYCEERTSRIFRARVITDTTNGDGRRLLLRLRRPITSVSSLSIDGTVLDPSEYFVHQQAGKIELRTRTFTPGVGNVSVTYTAGLTEAQLRSNPVYPAALDLAKSHYEEWMAGAISLSQISIGPATAIIKPGLNPRIEKFLDSIRDMRG